MSENAKWYVVHTYSGYENTVAESIKKAAENRQMQDLIQDVNIPMETVVERTESGESKEVTRKVFPGYVLVKMILTDESWHLVRNSRGCTGFVGSDGKPRLAIPSRSWTARWKASLARWTSWIPRGTASALSSPCSAGRRRSSWSLTRSSRSKKIN